MICSMVGDLLLFVDISEVIYHERADLWHEAACDVMNEASFTLCVHRNSTQDGMNSICNCM